MINKKYLKNLRCKEISNKNDFIFDLYGKRIIDSLEIINLNFKKILILGDHGIKTREYIKKKYKNSSITIYDLNNHDFDLDKWKVKNCEYDLIVSNFYLFLSDNFENILKKIIISLIPNGFFISTLPTKMNFSSLRSAMIKTDIDLYQGVYNRFNQFFELTNIIELLKKNNFKIPLVNCENINLEYNKFEKLLNDIRSMNLSYYNKDKKQKFEKKNYFKKLEKNYKKNLNNNFAISTIWSRCECTPPSLHKPRRWTVLFFLCSPEVFANPSKVSINKVFDCEFLLAFVIKIPAPPFIQPISNISPLVFFNDCEICHNVKALASSIIVRFFNSENNLKNFLSAIQGAYIALDIIIF